MAKIIPVYYYWLKKLSYLLYCAVSIAAKKKQNGLNTVPDHNTNLYQEWLPKKKNKVQFCQEKIFGKIQ